MSVVAHAIAAAGLGLRIFPMVPLTLEPVPEAPIDVATSSPAVIYGWYTNRVPNIGIATGSPSGVFVVELPNGEAVRWWAGSAHASTAVVDLPGGAQHHYYRQDDIDFDEVTLPHEARILGNGRYVIAPGSVLPQGTVRGSLESIVRADFDPRHAAEPTGDPLPLFAIQYLLPSTTSRGVPFFELMVEVPATGREAAARANVMREALSAGLSAEESLSVAWHSAASLALHEVDGGLDQIRREQSALPAHAAARGDTKMLLTKEERACIASSRWWEDRYTDWAGPGALNRIAPWIVLAEAFGGLAEIPRRGGPVPLEFPKFMIGASASAQEDARRRAEMVLRAIGHPGLDAERIQDLGPNGLPVWSWGSTEGGAASIGSRLWAIDEHDGAMRDLTEENYVEARSADIDPGPVRLAMELEDAKDRVRAVLGNGRWEMQMDPAALERHTEMKLMISGERLWATDAEFMQFADDVRKLATLAALAQGSAVVTLEHELLALEQAEGWITLMTPKSQTWAERQF